MAALEARNEPEESRGASTRPRRGNRCNRNPAFAGGSRAARSIAAIDAARWINTFANQLDYSPRRLSSRRYRAIADVRLSREYGMELAAIAARITGSAIDIPEEERVRARARACVAG